MSAIHDEPVFICGLGRSGTTWLAKTLGQSPELAFVGEAWLLEKLDELVRWHGVLHDEWGDYTTWRRHGIDRDAFVRAVARFYGDLLRGAAGGKRILEKTPDWNVFWLPLLHELFPRSRFVLLYRDGRNYVASAEAKNQREGKPFDFVASCRRWARAMDLFDEARRSGSPPAATLVRYEDLLRDFDSVFAEICDFVAIRPVIAKRFAPNSSFATHHRAADFNGRWRGWSEERKQIFRAEAGGQLVRWGYVDSPNGW